jgi:hypothetical protein
MDVHEIVEAAYRAAGLSLRRPAARRLHER